ncbi:transposase [Streptomyces sp. NPDC013187]
MGVVVRAVITGRWSTGVLWRLRTGAPWRDLPERYGPWQTVYERFAR